jgi:hypothetical protein
MADFILQIVGLCKLALFLVSVLAALALACSIPDIFAFLLGYKRVWNPEKTPWVDFSGSTAFYGADGGWDWVKLDD